MVERLQISLAVELGGALATMSYRDWEAQPQCSEVEQGLSALFGDEGAGQRNHRMRSQRPGAFVVGAGRDLIVGEGPSLLDEGFLGQQSLMRGEGVEVVVGICRAISETPRTVCTAGGKPHAGYGPSA